MSWDHLPAFNLASTPAFFGDEAASSEVDAKTGLEGDYRLPRPSARHTMLHLMHVANAAKHLERLPDPDETIHCVMKGNFAAWDLVPAVLTLSAPAVIDELVVATLGFNGRNARELLDLYDAGKVRSATFLCSCYFQGSCAEEFNALAEGLRTRGQRILAARNHAKIIALRMSDGRHVVLELSANLRSCRNVEQFAMTGSRELFIFHRSWILELFDHAARTQAQADEPEAAERQPGQTPDQQPGAQAQARDPRAARAPGRRSAQVVVQDRK